MSSFWISYTRNTKLTGRIRFVDHPQWRGHIVAVEVEEEWQWAQRQAPALSPIPDNEWQRRTRWRKAQPLDMADTSLRWVIDGPKVPA